jgi:hypothetical protein
MYGTSIIRILINVPVASAKNKICCILLKLSQCELTKIQRHTHEFFSGEGDPKNSVEGRQNGDMGAVGVPLNLQMNETRVIIRFL